uniref:Uncharacterized protein n=1 Tax=Acrobeloides nanus TaxID=290746 RepID=A0A914BXQ4_9BILA
MRILHTEGFNETEIINYRFMIYSNLIVSYHFVACGIYQLNITVPKDEAELIEKFFSAHFTMLDIDDHDQMVFLLEIKNYKSVAALMERKTEVYLPDNTV